MSPCPDSPWLEVSVDFYGPTPTAAAFGHFSAKFDDKNYRPVCKVCASVKKRAQTRFYCLACNVALCVENCFRIYHTEADIAKARQQLQ
ncbi:hypothetical protein RRG08_037245 [Elysia crispata]|uniref:PiggyBac transposable element-derived protein 4 C-terminal zinc-finger domain-containing protein n=1 Tax=Elysia crispata TaxID=231223 RepID=A0AAE1D1U1_9GAST|nr:hypothetical protein RRG08_037245 [Elysia crispata]